MARLWLLVLFVPVAHGFVMEDPAGDAVPTVGLASGPAGDAAGDLRTFSIEANGSWRMTWAYDGEEVDIQASVSWLSDGSFSVIGALDAQTAGVTCWLQDDDAGARVAWLVGEAAPGQISCVVPTDLVQALRHRPGPVNLTGLFASLEAIAVHGGPLTETKWVDRAPNEGFVETSIPVPLHSVGPFVVEVYPVASFTNGQASIERFELRIMGEGLLELSAVGLPPGWQAAFTATRLEVHQFAMVEVWVARPFRHVHGGMDVFAIETGYGSVPVQVGYFAVPQPGGHHPNLWIHSDGEMKWVSTLPGGASVPPDSWGIPVATENGFFGGGEWTLPLEPSLRLPLDIRDGGDLQLQVLPSEVIANAHVEVAIGLGDLATHPDAPEANTTWLWRGDAQIGEVASPTIVDVPLEASLTGLMEASPGQNLLLFIRLDGWTDTPHNEPPTRLGAMTRATLGLRDIVAPAQSRIAIADGPLLPAGDACLEVRGTGTGEVAVHGLDVVSTQLTGEGWAIVVSQPVQETPFLVRVGGNVAGAIVAGNPDATPCGESRSQESPFPFAIFALLPILARRIG